MEISAIIEDIIFRNEENGYTVCDVSSGEELITAVGSFPPISEGTSVVLKGNFADNGKYGRQFSVSDVEVVMPESAAGIERYLGSGLFPGVGEVTAHRIVERFAEETLRVIEIAPERLAEIRGISMNKAKDIGSHFLQLKAMQESIIYLSKFGVSINLAIKIYRKYEKDTIETVRKNPYILIEDVDGIGFATADKIAAAMGILPDSDFRIRASLMHVLKENANKKGNTAMPLYDLISEGGKLIGLGNEDRIFSLTRELLITGQLKSMEKEGITFITLASFYNIEQTIARRLIALQNEKESNDVNLENEIQIFESANEIVLHETQKEAIRYLLSSGVLIITGGPGTGKTTILKCALSVLKAKGLKITLCAPTGRAAKRMQEATGEQAYTIHRLLDLDFKDGKGYFTYNETTRLEADVIIIDEVSMTDDYVFCSLCKAIKKGASLVVVGDKDQLPSVGAGNVLADLIESGVFPVVHLTQIYRQSEQSAIITNAHKINQGKMPDLSNKTKDFFFDQKEDPSAMLETVLSMCSTRLPAFTGVSAMDIQVLAPVKKGVCGVENLNLSLQNRLNPPSSAKHEIRLGANVFREGDKIIQLTNNYQLEWKKEGLFGSQTTGTGVYNGDIGRVCEIDGASERIKILFEDEKSAWLTKEDMEHIALAYAITIHKSQGCEFDVALIVTARGNPQMLTRNLLYTAITRAKKTAVIVGERKSVEMMVRNNYCERRYSLLKYFIMDEYEIYR